MQANISFHLCFFQISDLTLTKPLSSDGKCISIVGFQPRRPAVNRGGKHSIVVTWKEKISYPQSISPGNTLLITGTKVRDYIRADPLQNICPVPAAVSRLGSQHSMFQNTKYKMTGDW